MTNQTSINQLHEAATLATNRRSQEAAVICREILKSEPQNVPALLWLAYSTGDEEEAREAINKAYFADRQNPTVAEAIEWFKARYVRTKLIAEPAPSTLNNKVEEISSPPKVEGTTGPTTPLCDPVEDHTNFIMTQSGGMLIISGLFLLGSIYLFLSSSGLLSMLLNGRAYNSIRGDIYTFVWGGAILVCATLFVFSLLDVNTPPVEAYGDISNRKIGRREMKDRYSTTTEYDYELDFLSDEEKAAGKMPVRLVLTKEQYEVSERSRRAFVVYSKRLKHVRLYQPVRSSF